MANSNRRILDRNGNQFIPMNVEGQSYSDNFWSTTKVVTLACILLGGACIIAFLSSNQAKPAGWVIIFGGFLILAFYLFRYIIFEEKFYYKMYKELQGNEITTPAIFWNIASIKNTEDGAILTYADGKIGLLVKLDRDTITGKPADFEETHYDAISDFYREITKYGYSFVQLNIMEIAGKDPRLTELDKIPVKCTNDNIRKLVELQIGHIKNIAQNSLYESDYILIYSTDITKIDNIIPDTIETMFTVLEGAYLGYRIMGRRDIIELEKESFGIKYFNSTDASLNIYKNNVNSSNVPFRIHSICWEDDEVQELDNMRKHKLRNITDSISSERITLEEAKIKEQIYEKKVEETPVDFSRLSSVPTKTVKPRINIHKPSILNKPMQSNQQEQNQTWQTGQVNQQQNTNSNTAQGYEYTQNKETNTTNKKFNGFDDFEELDTLDSFNTFIDEDDDDIVDI